jgi:hypothetical protein
MIIKVFHRPTDTWYDVLVDESAYNRIGRPKLHIRCESHTNYAYVGNENLARLLMGLGPYRLDKRLEWPTITVLVPESTPLAVLRVGIFWDGRDRTGWTRRNLRIVI